MHPRVRFDTAFTNALNLLKAHLPALAPEGQPVLLVRDVLGCFRVLINAPPPAAKKHDEAEAFIDDFASALGQYAPSAANTVQYLEDESPLNALFQQAEAWTPTGFPKHFKMLDRLVTGREWLLPQLPNAQPRPPRGVFFGLKGGVGRSTALTILAWHFSRLGKKVLVVDLDLESPGLGPMLLPVSSPQEGDTCVPGWPSFGIVDWLVEDAAGQADDELISDMYARSPLASNADILVVPACGGLLDQQYLAKLSRAYLELPDENGEIQLFGNRLARLLDQLESHVRPDVVLIDSRAGLHDISSIALTRLGAHSFLFAVNTRQTWEGYRHLFRHWQRNPDQLRELRQHLSTIGALRPGASGDYLREFCEASADVFAEIYDEDTGDGAFNFPPYVEDAPHYPIPIRAHGEYAVFEPLERSGQLDEDLIQFVFGDFLQAATDVLLSEAKE